MAHKTIQSSKLKGKTAHLLSDYFATVILLSGNCSADLLPLDKIKNIFVFYISITEILLTQAFQKTGP